MDQVSYCLCEMEVPEARDADTNEEVKQWQEIAGRLQAQLHEKRTLVSELRHAITTMATEIHDLKSSVVTFSTFQFKRRPNMTFLE